METKRVSRKPWKLRPARPEIVGTPDSHRRPDPGFEGGGPRRVVPSEAHPRGPDPPEVQIGPAHKMIEKRRDGHLVVRTDVRLVARLSLTGTIEGDGCQPPGEEHALP